MSSAISIKNLTVRFSEVLAVDDASLEIGDGEFISIVGPSRSEERRVGKECA